MSVTTAQPKASNYTRFNSASFVSLSLTISLVAEREDERASEIKDRQKPEKEKGYSQQRSNPMQQMHGIIKLGS
jgi:hypothetical protein